MLYREEVTRIIVLYCIVSSFNILSKTATATIDGMGCYAP